MAPFRKQNISPQIIKGWTRRLIFGEVKNGFQLQLRHLPKHQESNSNPPNLCACRGIPQQQKTGQKVAPKRMGNFHPTDKNPKDKINNPSIPSRDIKFHFMWGRHLQKLFNLTSLQLSFHPKSDRMASSDLSHHRALPWPSTAALTVLMVRFCGDPKKTAPPGMLTLMVVTWLALI